MVEGHQCAPPCAVGVRSALRPAAIRARLAPWARSVRIRSITPAGSCGGRPRAVGAGRGLVAGLRSASSRSSSSTGISLAPQGISTVATYAELLA